MLLIKERMWYDTLYCRPVKFAVSPDCRAPARYLSGSVTVNSGGLQYITVIWEECAPAHQ
jgi:hypothetical protein